MKKSKQITLVLMSALALSCRPEPPRVPYEGQKLYMRADTSAQYGRTHYTSRTTYVPVYHSFHPTGYWNGNTYHREGYYSQSIPRHSNVGSNPVKHRATTRGGFGGSARGHSSAS